MANYESLYRSTHLWRDPCQGGSGRVFQRWAGDPRRRRHRSVCLESRPGLCEGDLADRWYPQSL